ncbi:hypothetical protein [Croceivirga thetidis]|uniref:Bacteriocin n=1 Tax=Croceivirga thetidis TaxID=2721623 RepID=A0ABX1GLN7_9FLAO|nr:hypothetical protein [Croceivirga thetidis]NKI30793.1 hypothetical protein [Croceivirga thetidis]
MKKSKKIGLSLNKKVVSNFQQSTIKGGATRGWTYCSQGCVNTEFKDCTSLQGDYCLSQATCNDQ